ncbi:hypothetical protein AVEN_144019-1 [Araneus ventricosus]|uniref:Uncharacterized protein n=1 Tax=Araneus ventricosus TaxID=182803 RepID=A0A4Y2DEW8_ARAVE|nr:hypothetical protein AVEN_144019-1 [Araneus ventricosus]
MKSVVGTSISKSDAFKQSRLIVASLEHIIKVKVLPRSIIGIVAASPNPFDQRRVHLYEDGWTKHNWFEEAEGKDWCSS